MNTSATKYPSVWHQRRQKKYHQLEQARLNTLDTIKEALNHLEERYTWDDAYIFGSVFRHAYSYGLDDERVAYLIRKTISKKEMVLADLLKFSERIEEVVK